MSSSNIYIAYYKLLMECQHCIVAVKLDYIDSAWLCVRRIITGLTKLIESAESIYTENELFCYVKGLTPILYETKIAQQGRDQSKIADIIESELVPWLSQKLSVSEISHEEKPDFFDENINALNAIGQDELAKYITSYKKRAQDEHIICCNNAYGSVSFEYINGENRYNLTGLLHPYMDALFYAYDYRKDEKISYALAGGCMIYEALAFMAISIATKVFLFESDQELLFKIFKYLDLKEYILSERINFKFTNLINEATQFINDQTLLVKSTSTKGIVDTSLKQVYATYQMIIVSSREKAYLLFRNYYENMRIKAANIGTILHRFQGKPIYIIAGGPSLDRSIEVLKVRPQNSSIICVGTSAKKLLAEGIDPNYVIISDPLPEMKKQLDQPFDYKKTSLLFLATTYHEAVNNFIGEKYIVYQKDFIPSEEAASKEGMPIFRTGGSVTTLALDIALNSAASHIYCMGCDMAYTYNQMHVSGVDEIKGIATDSETKRVKGVTGDILETAQNLDSYRMWIEKRLREYKGDVSVTNISDGAYIHGMDNISCDEAINRFV